MIKAVLLLLGALLSVLVKLPSVTARFDSAAAAVLRAACISRLNEYRCGHATLNTSAVERLFEFCTSEPGPLDQAIEVAGFASPLLAFAAEQLNAATNRAGAAGSSRGPQGAAADSAAAAAASRILQLELPPAAVTSPGTSPSAAGSTPGAGPLAAALQQSGPAPWDLRPEADAWLTNAARLGEAAARRLAADVGRAVAAAAPPGQDPLSWYGIDASWRMMMSYYNGGGPYAVPLGAGGPLLLAYRPALLRQLLLEPAVLPAPADTADATSAAGGGQQQQQQQQLVPATWPELVALARQLHGRNASLPAVAGGGGGGASSSSPSPSHGRIHGVCLDVRPGCAAHAYVAAIWASLAVRGDGASTATSGGSSSSSSGVRARGAASAWPFDAVHVPQPHQPLVFDPATMEPQLDSPALAEALATWAVLAALSPPYHKTSGDGAAAAAAAGEGGACGGSATSHAALDVLHPAFVEGRCAVTIATPAAVKALVAWPPAAASAANGTSGGSDSSSSSSSSSSGLLVGSDGDGDVGVAMLPGSAWVADPAGGGRMAACGVHALSATGTQAAAALCPQAEVAQLSVFAAGLVGAATAAATAQVTDRPAAAVAAALAVPGALTLDEAATAPLSPAAPPSTAPATAEDPNAIHGSGGRNGTTISLRTALINRAPFVGLGGGPVAIVSARAAPGRQAAALQLLATTLAGPDAGWRALQSPQVPLFPVRAAHLSGAAAPGSGSAAAAVSRALLAVVKASLNHPNAVPPLTLPGAEQIMAVLRWAADNMTATATSLLSLPGLADTGAARGYRLRQANAAAVGSANSSSSSSGLIATAPVGFTAAQIAAIRVAARAAASEAQAAVLQLLWAPPPGSSGSGSTTNSRTGNRSPTGSSNASGAAPVGLRLVVAPPTVPGLWVFNNTQRGEGGSSNGSSNGSSSSSSSSARAGGVFRVTLASLARAYTFSLSMDQLTDPRNRRTSAAEAKPVANGVMFMQVGVPITCLASLLLGLLVWYNTRDARGKAYYAADAPAVSPDTTLLITDVQDSTVLWESLPAHVMDRAMHVHHLTLRKFLFSYSGYEASTEGDSFILGFPTATSALRYALTTQQALLLADWPEELLVAEGCAAVWAAPAVAAAAASVAAANGAAGVAAGAAAAHTATATSSALPSSGGGSTMAAGGAAGGAAAVVAALRPDGGGGGSSGFPLLTPLARRVFGPGSPTIGARSFASRAGGGAGSPMLLQHHTHPLFGGTLSTASMATSMGGGGGGGGAGTVSEASGLLADGPSTGLAQGMTATHVTFCDSLLSGPLETVTVSTQLVARGVERSGGGGVTAGPAAVATAASGEARRSLQGMLSAALAALGGGRPGEARLPAPVLAGAGAPAVAGSSARLAASAAAEPGLAGRSMTVGGCPPRTAQPSISYQPGPRATLSAAAAAHQHQHQHQHGLAGGSTSGGPAAAAGGPRGSAPLQLVTLGSGARTPCRLGSPRLPTYPAATSAATSLALSPRAATEGSHMLAQVQPWATGGASPRSPRLAGVPLAFGHEGLLCPVLPQGAAAALREQPLVAPPGASAEGGAVAGQQASCTRAAAGDGTRAVHATVKSGGGEVAAAGPGTGGLLALLLRARTAEVGGAAGCAAGAGARAGGREAHHHCAATESPPPPTAQMQKPPVSRAVVTPAAPHAPSASAPACGAVLCSSAGSRATSTAEGCSGSLTEGGGPAEPCAPVGSSSPRSRTIPPLSRRQPPSPQRAALRQAAQGGSEPRGTSCSGSGGTADNRTTACCTPLASGVLDGASTAGATATTAAGASHGLGEGLLSSLLLTSAPSYQNTATASRMCSGAAGACCAGSPATPRAHQPRSQLQVLLLPGCGAVATGYESAAGSSPLPPPSPPSHAGGAAGTAAASARGGQQLQAAEPPVSDRPGTVQSAMHDHHPHLPHHDVPPPHGAAQHAVKAWDTAMQCAVSEVEHPLMLEVPRSMEGEDAAARPALTTYEQHKAGQQPQVLPTLQVRIPAVAGGASALAGSSLGGAAACGIGMAALEAAAASEAPSATGAGMASKSLAGEEVDDESTLGTPGASSTIATVAAAAMLGDAAGGGGGGSSTEAALPLHAVQAAQWTVAAAGVPGASLVFKGLRVRMGLHAGVSSASEMSYNRAAARVMYCGPVLRAAKAVSDCAHGGQVVLSASAFRGLSHWVLNGEDGTAAWYSGQHLLQDELPPMDLYLLLSRALLPRAALLPHTLRAKLPPLHPPACDALTGPVAVAALSLVPCGADALAAELAASVAALEGDGGGAGEGGWGLGQSPAVKAAVARCVSAFEGLAVQLMRLLGGALYEAEGGSLVAGFASARRAVLWLLHTQALMHAVPWEAAVLRAAGLTETRTFPLLGSSGPAAAAGAGRGHVPAGSLHSPAVCGVSEDEPPGLVPMGGTSTAVNAGGMSNGVGTDAAAVTTTTAPGGRGSPRKQHGGGGGSDYPQLVTMAAPRVKGAVELAVMPAELQRNTGRLQLPPRLRQRIRKILATARPGQVLATALVEGAFAVESHTASYMLLPSRSRSTPTAASITAAALAARTPSGGSAVAAAAPACGGGSATASGPMPLQPGSARQWSESNTPIAAVLEHAAHAAPGPVPITPLPASLVEIEEVADDDEAACQSSELGAGAAPGQGLQLSPRPRRAAGAAAAAADGGDAAGCSAAGCSASGCKKPSSSAWQPILELWRNGGASALAVAAAAKVLPAPSPAALHPLPRPDTEGPGPAGAPLPASAAVAAAADVGMPAQNHGMCSVSDSLTLLSSAFRQSPSLILPNRGEAAQEFLERCTKQLQQLGVLVPAPPPQVGPKVVSGPGAGPAGWHGRRQYFFGPAAAAAAAAATAAARIIIGGPSTRRTRRHSRVLFFRSRRSDSMEDKSASRHGGAGKGHGSVAGGDGSHAPSSRAARDSVPSELDASGHRNQRKPSVSSHHDSGGGSQHAPPRAEEDPHARTSVAASLLNHWLQRTASTLLGTTAAQAGVDQPPASGSSHGAGGGAGSVACGSHGSPACSTQGGSGGGGGGLRAGARDFEEVRRLRHRSATAMALMPHTSGDEAAPAPLAGRSSAQQPRVDAGRGSSNLQDSEGSGRGAKGRRARFAEVPTAAAHGGGSAVQPNTSTAPPDATPAPAAEPGVWATLLRRLPRVGQRTDHPRRAGAAGSLATAGPVAITAPAAQHTAHVVISTTNGPAAVRGSQVASRKSGDWGAESSAFAGPGAAVAASRLHKSFSHARVGDGTDAAVAAAQPAPAAAALGGGGGAGSPPPTATSTLGARSPSFRRASSRSQLLAVPSPMSRFRAAGGPGAASDALGDTAASPSDELIGLPMPQCVSAAGPAPVVTVATAVTSASGVSFSSSRRGPVGAGSRRLLLAAVLGSASRRGLPASLQQPARAASDTAGSDDGDAADLRTRASIDGGDGDSAEGVPATGTGPADQQQERAPRPSWQQQLRRRLSLQPGQDGGATKQEAASGRSGSKSSRSRRSRSNSRSRSSSATLAVDGTRADSARTAVGPASVGPAASSAASSGPSRAARLLGLLGSGGRSSGSRPPTAAGTDRGLRHSQVSEAFGFPDISARPSHEHTSTQAGAAAASADRDNSTGATDGLAAAASRDATLAHQPELQKQQHTDAELLPLPAQEDQQQQQQQQPLVLARVPAALDSLPSAQELLRELLAAPVRLTAAEVAGGAGAGGGGGSAAGGDAEAKPAAATAAAAAGGGLFLCVLETSASLVIAGMGGDGTGTSAASEGERSGVDAPAGTLGSRPGSNHGLFGLRRKRWLKLGSAKKGSGRSVAPAAGKAALRLSPIAPGVAAGDGGAAGALGGGGAPPAAPNNN
ncbi:hypothetical protein HYH02_013371 [Chlamydomonas schloesseri]|uniref:Guanylate cyclase domain-containing protein n=1 Tax=Chlamydomonas schloesseri TaxID=2026947 RepID=A0A835VZH2_9CHLO|nr:hypothetical protein HYH02_013371 [Chlamydomonas schloesseri]|eukprot:KAG2431384.1 hypothetical protein HYH02_013371 [Chlamydomonas schloesseri]